MNSLFGQIILNLDIFHCVFSMTFRFYKTWKHDYKYFSINLIFLLLYSSLDLRVPIVRFSSQEISNLVPIIVIYISIVMALATFNFGFEWWRKRHILFVGKVILKYVLWSCLLISRVFIMSLIIILVIDFGIPKHMPEVRTWEEITIKQTMITRWDVLSWWSSVYILSWRWYNCFVDPCPLILQHCFLEPQHF